MTNLMDSLNINPKRYDLDFITEYRMVYGITITERLELAKRVGIRDIAYFQEFCRDNDYIENGTEMMVDDIIQHIIYCVYDYKYRSKFSKLTMHIQYVSAIGDKTIDIDSSDIDEQLIANRILKDLFPQSISKSFLHFTNFSEPVVKTTIDDENKPVLSIKFYNQNRFDLTTDEKNGVLFNLDRILFTSHFNGYPSWDYDCRATRGADAGPVIVLACVNNADDEYTDFIRHLYACTTTEHCQDILIDTVGPESLANLLRTNNVTEIPKRLNLTLKDYIGDGFPVIRLRFGKELSYKEKDSAHRPLTIRDKDLYLTLEAL